MLQLTVAVLLCMSKPSFPITLFAMTVYADYELRGVGQTMWQVILGRVISGAGAAGMAGLVSILITGRPRSNMVRLKCRRLTKD